MRWPNWPRRCWWAASSADRPGLPALPLGTNGVLQGALAVVTEPDQVLARQVQTLGAPGDLLLLLDTHGNDDSLKAALAAAQAKDMTVLVLSGGDGGALGAALSDTDVLVALNHGPPRPHHGTAAAGAARPVRRDRHPTAGRTGSRMTPRFQISAPRAAWLALALAGGSTLLSACAPLMVGGAMLGGTLMVTDRRTSGAQLEDQAIELKSVNRLREALGERGHISVTSYNRMVLITGEVPDDATKASAEQVVAKVENVKSTVNELGVMGSSSLTARSNDAILTSKVKATFVDTKDLHANAIKVVTERSVVYLMGRVTEKEGARAADLARTVSGVQKVVRVFEYITEAELQGPAAQGSEEVSRAPPAGAYFRRRIRLDVSQRPPPWACTSA